MQHFVPFWDQYRNWFAFNFACKVKFPLLRIGYRKHKSPIKCSCLYIEKRRPGLIILVLNEAFSLLYCTFSVAQQPHHYRPGWLMRTAPLCPVCSCSKASQPRQMSSTYSLWKTSALPGNRTEGNAVCHAVRALRYFFRWKGAYCWSLSTLLQRWDKLLQPLKAPR